MRRADRLWWRSLLYRVAGAILAVAIVLLILEIIVRSIGEPYMSDWWAIPQQPDR